MNMEPMIIGNAVDKIVNGLRIGNTSMISARKVLITGAAGSGKSCTAYALLSNDYFRNARSRWLVIDPFAFFPESYGVRNDLGRHRASNTGQMLDRDDVSRLSIHVNEVTSTVIDHFVDGKQRIKVVSFSPDGSFYKAWLPDTGWETWKWMEKKGDHGLSRPLSTGKIFSRPYKMTSLGAKLLASIVGKFMSNTDNRPAGMLIDDVDVIAVPELEESITSMLKWADVNGNVVIAVVNGHESMPPRYKAILDSMDRVSMNSVPFAGLAKIAGQSILVSLPW